MKAEKVFVNYKKKKPTKKTPLQTLAVKVKNNFPVNLEKTLQYVRKTFGHVSEELLNNAQLQSML